MEKLVTRKTKKQIRQMLKKGKLENEIISLFTEQGFSETDIVYEIQISKEDEVEKRALEKHKQPYYFVFAFGTIILALGIYSFFQASGTYYIGAIFVGGGLFTKSLVELSK